MIQKAIIPAGGLGTRMQPVTLALPKEMLPVGTRPMFQFALEEAVDAGIGEIGIVLSDDKKVIQDYLGRLQEEGEYPGIQFHFFRQEKPRGLADAIDCCRLFVEGEPFALLLPDNVILSPRYRFSSLIELYRRHRCDVVGVIEVNEGNPGSYANVGRINYEKIDDYSIRITRLYDKGTGIIQVSDGETFYRTCGRYICHDHLFSHLDRVRPRIRGEFDEVPVYQQIIEECQAIGSLIPMPLFDTGNPGGFLAANAYLYQKHLG